MIFIGFCQNPPLPSVPTALRWQDRIGLLAEPYRRLLAVHCTYNVASPFTGTYVLEWGTCSTVCTWYCYIQKQTLMTHLLSPQCTLWGYPKISLTKRGKQKIDTAKVVETISNQEKLPAVSKLYSYPPLSRKSLKNCQKMLKIATNLVKNMFYNFFLSWLI